MADIIELRDVYFSAQGNLLVDGVSLAFPEGQAAALVGPSGGGKSTVLKLAAGLCIPSRGEVFFRGTALGRMSRQENLAFRKEAAFVFQDSALWANQSLLQTLELPLRLHFPEMGERERKRRVMEVAGEVGYRRELGIRPAGLSMGEQKLVAFARSLVLRPDLLFLDEWTESLDEKSADRLVEIVRRMKESGSTVIFVSHDPRIVLKLADRVILVSGGRVSELLSKEELDSAGFHSSNRDEDLLRLMETGETRESA
ncbi:MAG: ATP-binding cassette domain-containing protein [Treponema sp.]|nr:ATP-binding cassette domain-containing protein [Treponema sp.]